MADQILLALQITVIGMGLVFGAILLLWLIMAALVRLLEDRPRTEPADLKADLRAARERAAAVAVAIALAQDASLEPHEFPLPPTAIVSAWQAVRRSINLNKRGTLR
jgi:Na+-transporting methylmalonyl-CoA/oxaloacetate decarboxylase gamma subunit